MLYLIFFPVLYHAHKNMKTSISKISIADGTFAL